MVFVATVHLFLISSIPSYARVPRPRTTLYFLDPTIKPVRFNPKDLCSTTYTLSVPPYAHVNYHSVYNHMCLQVYIEKSQVHPAKIQLWKKGDPRCAESAKHGTGSVYLRETQCGSRSRRWKKRKQAIRGDNDKEQGGKRGPREGRNVEKIGSLGPWDISRCRDAGMRVHLVLYLSLVKMLSISYKHAGYTSVKRAEAKLNDLLRPLVVSVYDSSRNILICLIGFKRPPLLFPISKCKSTRPSNGRWFSGLMNGKRVKLK